MTILDEIITTRPSAPRITLYGKRGVGKSTLAATFPKPFFFLTEENAINDLKAFRIQDFNDMCVKVKALLELPEIPFETIVIDSVSKFDYLLTEYILATDPNSTNNKKPLTLNQACGGYGAGVLRAQRLHRKFKKLMDKFQERGITVVYIAHEAVVRIKSPESEDYDIFSITMNNDKSREIYLDDVDAVLFCKIKSFVYPTDSGRHIIKSTNEHIMITSVSESHVSKNRYNMPEELPLSFEEIKKYIPFYNQNPQ